MPNARVANTVPNSRSSNVIPNSRVSVFQTGRAGEKNLTPAGTPIGLLLALTYSGTETSVPYGDFRPTVRVVTL